MKAIFAGAYSRRKFPCFIYGIGRIHPLKGQISSESLNWCKVIVSSHDRNYSHHLFQTDSPALRGLDLRQISSLNSISHQSISGCPPYAILPHKVCHLTPLPFDQSFRLMSTNTEASSKVEETVRRLKEKHEEKLKEIHKIQDIDES